MPRQQWVPHRDTEADLRRILTTFGRRGEGLLGEFFAAIEHRQGCDRAPGETSQGPVRAFPVRTGDAELAAFFTEVDAGTLALLHVWATWCTPAPAVVADEGAWRCPPPQAAWELAAERMDSGGI